METAILRKARAAAAVVGVWTSPDKTRDFDEPALQTPAALRQWLDGMTVEEKLDLCEGNRLQTQVLYGADVLVVEERDGWAHILIPSQSTRKHAEGYPGWVPLRQLADVPEEEEPAESWAVVASDKAQLDWSLETDGPQELSFLTRLPVLEESEHSITVRTPHGPAVLKRADVSIRKGNGSEIPEGPADVDGKHTGNRIVEAGFRYEGLPYLWSGMSSYGYDCSGFAYNMHLSQGIVIPRDCSDQVNSGQPVEKEQLEPGDLLFFAYEEGKGRVHHVGIYAGDNRMIHSPDSRSVIEIVELPTYKLIHEHCASRRYWGS